MNRDEYAAQHGTIDPADLPDCDLCHDPGKHARCPVCGRCVCDKCWADGLCARCELDAEIQEEYEIADAMLAERGKRNG